MKQIYNGLFAIVAAIPFTECIAQQNITRVNTATGVVTLPSPYATPSVNNRAKLLAGPMEKNLLPLQVLVLLNTPVTLLIPGGYTNCQMETCWFHRLKQGEITEII